VLKHRAMKTYGGSVGLPTSCNKTYGRYIDLKAMSLKTQTSVHMSEENHEGQWPWNNSVPSYRDEMMSWACNLCNLCCHYMTREHHETW